MGQKRMNILDFLGDMNKREGLIEILLSFRDETQEEFFDKTEAGTGKHLSKILDEIFYLVLNQEPLYNRWSKKIDGKIRNLSVPKPPLRRLIEDYLLPLVKTEQAHANCHGGEKNWSPERSLSRHLPVRSVLSFDLKNAFELFPLSEIYRFYSELIEKSNLSHSNEIAEFLTLISTVNYGNNRGLPVGSPISISLINRTLLLLDKKLTENSERRGFRYSRWIDDLTVSSPFEDGIEGFLGAIELTNRKYHVSPTKVFFQHGSQGIYLLGHKISNGRISKNNKEERIAKKSTALEYEGIFKQNYDSWN